MNKALSIALAVAVALVAAATATAGAEPDVFERAVARNAALQHGSIVTQPPPDAFERAVARRSATPRFLGPIQFQELGRHSDPRLTYPAGAPVLVAGAPDDFDARDAVIGGGAGFALALLGMAAVAYGVTRRSRSGLSST
jgi:hypothetical protein